MKIKVYLFSNFFDIQINGSFFRLKFTGIEINAEEPLWVVNYKKSIASQLQLDITGVRRDGIFNYESVPAEEETKSFTVFEVFDEKIFMMFKYSQT